MKKLIFVGLALVSFSLHANWVCSVNDNQDKHWSFSAPTESSAEAMAKNVCTKHNIKGPACSPDCYDNGVAKGRWHCVVADNKDHHWSYFAPELNDAKSLVKSACQANQIKDKECKARCIPE